MRPCAPTTLLLMLVLLLQSWPALAVQEPARQAQSWAGGSVDWVSPQELVSMQSGGKSLGQAVQQVKRQYQGGRIISAETRRSGNREVHHIKVLTADGKVRTVKVQGRSLGSRD